MSLIQFSVLNLHVYHLTSTPNKENKWVTNMLFDK